MITNPSAELIFATLTEIGIIDQFASAELQRALGSNLSVSEYGVLNHFVRVGVGNTPSMLAQIFQMTKPSMTAIIAKLEAKSYVTVTASTRDRRRKFVKITEAGRQARSAAMAAVAPLAEERFAGFDTAKLEALYPLLTELREHLDKARNNADGLS